MNKREFSSDELNDLTHSVCEVILEADAVDPAGAGAEAEQFFRLGALALEQAQRYFTLAAFAQARAVLGPTRREP